MKYIITQHFRILYIHTINLRCLTNEKNVNNGYSESPYLMLNKLHLTINRLLRHHPFPKMTISTVTAFQLLNNLVCQHLASLYSLLLHDFVEDSARKSNTARNIPKTSANHPKYISVGKMFPVQDSDRCCLGQEHLAMWECLKPVSSCQGNLFSLVLDEQTIK